MSDATATTSATGTAHELDVAAVEVATLVKFYEGTLEPALDGLDLTVAPGEFVAITGPSGCGKSTLLHLIAALDVPTSGTIRVYGHDLSNLPDTNAYRRNQVGLVFQLHNLLPRMTVRQNVEVAMLGTHRSARERRTRAIELLADVDLGGRQERLPTELSGGERQRVAIARALANEPTLLLADEPTGNLDSASVETVLELFARLRSQHNTTILFVTHDTTVAETAERVVHMRDGRVVDAGQDPG